MNTLLSPFDLNTHPSLSANLSLSTCSTSEVEGDKPHTSSMDLGQDKEMSEDTAGEKKEGEEEEQEGGAVEGNRTAAALSEAGFITVHLKVPGVPHRVDVMVWYGG